MPSLTTLYFVILNMKPSNERNLQERYIERQLCVQKRNLTHVCRCAMKTLIDRSCFDEIDDTSDELINFCAIMEDILNHRLKAAFSWRNPLETRYFWDYVRVACRDVPNNCLGNIERMENIKSSKAKGRAWLRLVLMEKRMSEYISMALLKTRETREMYMEGAMMLSDEMHTLNDALLGLNAIDFTLCLKGEDLDIGKHPAIDYSPFLNFQQSQEGDRSDAEELHHLNGKQMVEMDDNSWQSKFSKLETMYKTSCEQKGYLEELVRLRESQYHDIIQQRDQTVVTLRHVETQSQKDRAQLEAVVLELQQQLSSLKEEYKSFQRKVETYFRQHRTSDISHESDWLSIGSTELQSMDSRRPGGDSRSIYSSASGTSGPSKEDSPSLAPLHGSITSQTSLLSSDSNFKNAQPANFHEKSTNESRSETLEKESSDPLEELENQILEPRPSQDTIEQAHESSNLDLFKKLGDEHASNDNDRESVNNDFEMVAHEAGEVDKLSWDNFPLENSLHGSEEELVEKPIDIDGDMCEVMLHDVQLDTATGGEDQNGTVSTDLTNEPL